MTAVIYARYSTDSQREESIEGHVKKCTSRQVLLSRQGTVLNSRTA